MNRNRPEADPSLHVLIAGGGIGGLCLAQGLKKSGVRVTVYERDPSAQFRNQGYRIHINPDDSHALHECLPEHLFNLCLATSTRDQPGNLVSFDQQLKEMYSMPLPVKDDADISRIGTSVNRNRSEREIRGAWTVEMKFRLSRPPAWLPSRAPALP